VKIQEDINSRLIGGKEQSNIRSGRSRYTQQLADGVISDEEQQGADRISDIYSRMNYEIAQAESARDKGQLDIFNTKMSTLDKLNDNMNAEIGNLNSLAMDKLKELRDQQKQTASDQLAQKKAKSEEAKAIAGGIATSIEGYSDDEMVELIGELAKTRGLDPLELLSQVTESMNDQQKAELDLQNIESQIIAREQGTQIDRQRENRLSLDSGSGGSGSTPKLTTAQQTKMYGLGFTQSQSDAISQGIAKYGIDAVMANLTTEDDQPLTEDMQKKIRAIFGDEEAKTKELTEKTARYLTEDYIDGGGISEATLKKLAKKYGFHWGWGFTGTDKTEIVDYLVKVVVPELRAQGKTDDQIKQELGTY